MASAVRLADPGLLLALLLPDIPSGLNWRQRIPADKNGASIYGCGLDTEQATGSCGMQTQHMAIEAKHDTQESLE